MSYDAKVPLQLKKIQQWFGGIIGCPIDEDSRINPLTPAGNPIEEESAIYIAPSPTLRPAQRIQIYNQQYWWRLLSTLHESFPLVTRLFGYYDFNKTLAIPYLVKYPPCHWSLSYLGDRFVKWIEESYHANDKQLVLDAARVDWGFVHSFVAAEIPPMKLETISEGENLLEKKLFLQPHVCLMQMKNDMFSYRIEFLKQDPDYWIDNDFPVLNKNTTGYYALFRGTDNDIYWHEMSATEYHLLSLFQKGMKIERACDWLECQEKTIADDAAKHLQSWFQEWTKRRWLSVVNPASFCVLEN